MTDNLKEREAFEAWWKTVPIHRPLAHIDALAAWNARAALAQAEALQDLEEMRADRDSWAQQASDRAGEVVQFAQELEALKRAISEAEPVAWLHVCAKKQELRTVTFWKTDYELKAKGYKPQPLYTLKGIK